MAAILVINPGSTSTKLALFDTEVSRQVTVDHDPASFNADGGVVAQLGLREDAVLAFLTEAGDPRLEAVVGRGGPLRPLEGGTWLVDDAMVADLKSARWGEHASLLGGLLARRLADRHGVNAYVVDPVSVDEMDPLARLSGVPGIERNGRSHALNIKAVARLAADELGKPLPDTRFAVAHMGGGISVAAMRGGRIADVNDALLGMGPFSPYRAGALPIRGILDLAFAEGADRRELEKKLSTESGLQGYLGTGDLREVEKRIDDGDGFADRILRAMGLQIAKEIGAVAAFLGGDLDGVILTGGMAKSELLLTHLRERIGWIAPIQVFAGEREMDAMAAGARRILNGKEAVRLYGDSKEAGA